MNGSFEARFSNIYSRLPQSIRGLIRHPGYPLAGLTMLGLAVGVNAAVFAILYGISLKPLPYAQPNHISVVRERLVKIGLNTPLVSVSTYVALKKGLHDIANAGLATNDGDDIATVAGHSRLLAFREVTPSLFQTLGVQPVLGRLPNASTGRPGGNPDAVISWRLWQSAYGGRRSVLGQSLKISGKTYHIAAVMPNDFLIETYKDDVWLPYIMTAKRARNTNINYWMMVRRKPGVSLHRFNVTLANYVHAALAKKTPQQRTEDIKHGYAIDARAPGPLMLNLSGVGHIPWLLQAAAGLVLLLALANTINLGLVRQRARQYDFALRHVLGSSKRGLIRLILIEHAPIALLVGSIASLLAWAGISALHDFGLPPTYSPFRITLAPAVFEFTWIVTALAVAVVVSGPALLATGQRLLTVLGHGPTATGGKGPRRIQRALGITQIALSCTLVIAGGLLSASLWKMLSQPVGFALRHRLTITIATPDAIKNDSAAWTILKPALSKVPGIEREAITGMAPFSGSFSMGDVGMIGKDRVIHCKLPLVSANYFATLDIPFLAGRGFSASQIARQAPVIVINAFLAKQFFGSAHKAIGQYLSIAGKRRVIGVTRDILWAPTPDQYEAGTAYLPLGVYNEGFTVVMVTRGPVAPLKKTLKRVIKTTLPGSVVFRMTAMPQMVRKAAIFSAVAAGLLGTFAALALLIAALGVFAITAVIARARLGEYGIRAALGASPGALLRLGFSEAVWLLAIGLPFGLAGAWLLGHALAGALYQTPAFDIGLYAAGTLMIAVVVLAAAWRPARHAARTPVKQLIGGNHSQ